MLYPFFRPLVFTLDPETAHDAAFRALDWAARLGVAQRWLPSVARSPVDVMGIAFPNRVGLAAGLDKDAEHVDALASLGFGHIECGTVTPRPQPGNPKPRLFRLVDAEALVNRMGFNNVGVVRFLSNLERARWRGIVGVNIGRNFDTPNERAVDDYLACLRAVYVRAAYVTVNVSSPNTKGLRDLQNEEALARLLAALATERERLADAHGKRTPIAVKVAPDLDYASLDAIARILVAHGMDAVIATNTTIARDGVRGMRHAEESGGLSGRPLRERATAVVRRLAHALDGALPIVGVGGIMTGDDAKEKLDAGATLVQLYTGLIYRGPQLVAECAQTTRETGPAEGEGAVTLATNDARLPRSRD